MRTQSRPFLIGAGLFLIVFWFVCSAATVIPGVDQVIQFVVLVTFPVLAGLTFRAAFRQPPRPPDHQEKCDGRPK